MEILMTIIYTLALFGGFCLVFFIIKSIHWCLFANYYHEEPVHLLNHIYHQVNNNLVSESQLTQQQQHDDEETKKVIQEFDDIISKVNIKIKLQSQRQTI